MNTNDQEQGLEPGGPLRCPDVQAALLDYVGRELGAGRMDLVREHLRLCAACQQAAVDLQRTMEALRGAPLPVADGDPHLSEERRARIRWSIMHPVLDGIYRHHSVVSGIVAVGGLALIVWLLHTIRPDWLKWERTGVEVTIGQGEPPHAE